MKKIVLKVIVFIGILLGILIILSEITIPKNNNLESGIYNLKANGILSEKENTIDMLVVGDSEVFSAVIPLELWNKYGYTSYICCSPDQTLPESLSFVYKTYDKQKPKIIILEANNIFRKTSLDEGIEKIFYNLLPVTEYHSRWKHLTKEDFYKKPEYTWVNEMRGYDFSRAIDSADDTNYMVYSDEYEEIDDTNKFYVKLLNNMCIKNNTKFIILSTPSTINWDYKKHNAIKKFAENENIEFLDLNVLKDIINIDWKTESRDKGDHLNQDGAEKVTEYLGNYLYEKNILENHHDDERFKEWNEYFEKYQNLKNEI